MNDKHFDWRADSLPEIDAVEVVDLEEVEPLTGSDRWRNLGGHFLV